MNDRPSALEPRRPAVYPETVIGFAILGCLIAGGLCIIRAFSAPSAADTLLYVAGALAQCATVTHIFFRHPQRGPALQPSLAAVG